MAIEIKTKTYVLRGETHSYQVESQVVPVELAGETREIEIERTPSSEGSTHCWYASSQLVICRYIHGNKTHGLRPHVCERDGKWFIPVQKNRSSRYGMYPVRWCDDTTEITSKW